ncbi:hypothetical protein [Enterococcus caccae]|uniref:Uncharacterized protein n=1 Tax=Enterococcus caccae ATCC BAA-1240 TaxID=1158612 RepID=R3WND0_9ENTE|nr:hypothetical protein [Enterococcus caccae]EOL43350.1 hypothetical protein UC7_02679 [Enterococcus caccae ATCC BAA-1240]EOT68250.1 hypothetical protein I580_00633 [Enterococcus caccae ATCC BAA-1240]OJG26883.1 hypothetical protein RU98_GL002974 [Enterococcus caccae]
MSEKFRYFICDDEMSRIEDIISEINSSVAGDDIEVRDILDSGIGEKYFYAYIELARNMIMSFEKDDPKPPFAVGKYYSYRNAYSTTIFKVTEIEDATCVWVKEYNEKEKTILTKIEFGVNTDRAVHLKPATAEQIAEFKRAEELREVEE